MNRPPYPEPKPEAWAEFPHPADYPLGKKRRKWVWKLYKFDTVMGQAVMCFHCRQWLTFAQFTVEHVIPRKRGGPDCIRNLRPACVACNSRRGAKRIPAEDSIHKTMMDSIQVGSRVFWAGIADDIPFVRSGTVEAEAEGKWRVIDEGGQVFTKSVRALYSTRAAADAALRRLLLRCLDK